MKTNSQLAVNIAAIAVAMFCLAYASVPLYRLFCQVTGFGGTPQQALKAPDTITDRVITVRFNADIDPNLAWRFTPGETLLKLKVGEQKLTHFVAKNIENKPTTGRAAYNVVPNMAGVYFMKVECFCFINQTLQAGQQVNMPVSFFIDPSIMDDPEMNDVDTITLSYTFFPVKK